MAKKKTKRRQGTPKKSPQSTAIKDNTSPKDAPISQDAQVAPQAKEAKKKPATSGKKKSPVVNKNTAEAQASQAPQEDPVIQQPPQEIPEAPQPEEPVLGPRIDHFWDRLTGFLFLVDDDKHWKRHANPWSVWTSFSCLPLLVLAIYSRMWWGMYSWIAVALAILWHWLNPRIFAAPKTTRCWASYAVFGERLWFHRYDTSLRSKIPHHHFTAIYSINFIMLVNAVFLAVALIELKLSLVILSTIIQVMGHCWFYDRMVWLFTDMYYEDEEYESWVY